MLWVPTVRFVVLHAAVRVLPLPESAMAEQPPMEAKPSRKLTVPVGDVPVTLPVSVTFAPRLDGFAELVSVVDVGDPLAFVTLTVSALDVAERTVMLTPYGPSL